MIIYILIKYLPLVAILPKHIPIPKYASVPHKNHSYKGVK